MFSPGKYNCARIFNFWHVCSFKNKAEMTTPPLTVSVERQKMHIKHLLDKAMADIEIYSGERVGYYLSETE